MKIIHTKIAIKVYDSPDELSDSDRSLLAMAVKQTEKAYAPYSRFQVGAAVRLESGEIYLGSNQENVSYPLSMCAERVVLYTAASLHPNTPILEMAIAAKGEVVKIDKPVTPCGACRQVICEFENRFKHPIRLLLQGRSQIYEIASGKDLLILSFDQSYLLGK